LRDLDINEVARRSGLPASALRHYEEKGLVVSVGRRGLRRLFDPSVLQRLALIAMGRAAGFSLAEMAGMFGPDGKPRIDRKLLAAKADELDATIRHLGSMRAALRRMAQAEPPRVSDLPAHPACGGVGQARRAPCACAGPLIPINTARRRRRCRLRRDVRRRACDHCRRDQGRNRTRGSHRHRGVPV